MLLGGLLTGLWGIYYGLFVVSEGARFGWFVGPTLIFVGGFAAVIGGIAEVHDFRSLNSHFGQAYGCDRGLTPTKIVASHVLAPGNIFCRGHSRHGRRHPAAIGIRHRNANANVRCHPSNGFFRFPSRSFQVGRSQCV